MSISGRVPLRKREKPEITPTCPAGPQSDGTCEAGHPGASIRQEAGNEGPALKRHIQDCRRKERGRERGVTGGREERKKAEEGRAADPLPARHTCFHHPWNAHPVLPVLLIKT